MHIRIIKNKKQQQQINKQKWVGGKEAGSRIGPRHIFFNSVIFFLRLLTGLSPLLS
jgi:hypothetical protein